MDSLQLMPHDTLTCLIFARLLCLPHNMVAAKSEELARKRLSERVEKDVLKLFPAPPPAFQQHLHQLVSTLLTQQMRFSGSILHLSETAQQAAITFLQLSNRRTINELTWEQVRTVHLIVIALKLSERQQDRVKNESKLQASILANYYHQIPAHAELFHGTLGQVSRELARLAVDAKSSRIGDLKKAILQQWTGELMQAYLTASDAAASLVTAGPSAVTLQPATPPVTATSVPNSNPKPTSKPKPKGETVTTLVGFAEQIEAILPEMTNQQQTMVSIVHIWHYWRTEHPHHIVDFVTFKQLLVEAGKRQLLQLMPAPPNLTLSENELQESAVRCGEQICHLVQVSA